MKKRMIHIMLLITILTSSLAYTVQAHNVELDPNSYIYMPSRILNGKGTIRISSLAGSDYTLYYQKVDISKSVHTEIQEKNQAAQEYADSESAKLTAERANVLSLENEYKEIRDNTNSTQDQIEAAYTTYKNALDSYNEKIEEYNTKLSEYKSQIANLIPTYQESSWSVATGTSSNVNLDFSGYSGEINFALWAKMVTSKGTYYDVDCYSTNIEEDISISLDKTTAELKVSQTLKLTATTNSDKTITWTSSKEDVATVDANGNVKALKEGVTVITATVDGKSDTCTVTVVKTNNDGEGNKNETDFSNVKFTYSSKNLRNLKIQIDGYTPKANNQYYMYISKNKNESITNIPEEAALIGTDSDGINSVEFLNDKASKILECPGTNYIYIIEKNIASDEKQVVLKAKEMPKIDLPSLGLRLDMWLYDYNSAKISNTVKMSDDRNVTYKIGKITSNDILKSFKNDSSNKAYSNLLNYAKNADYMTTGTITLEGLDYNPVNKLNIEEDAYYFVYMIADNKDGKYIDIEDVAIYKENNDSQGNGLVHFDFKDIEIDEEEQDKDTTTAPDNSLPQTGVSNTIICAMTLITLAGVIVYIKFKKYIDIK